MRNHKLTRFASLFIFAICLFMMPVAASANGEMTPVNEYVEGEYASDDTYYLDDESGSSFGTFDPAGASQVVNYTTWADDVIVEKVTTDIIVYENNIYDVTKTLRVFYNTESGHELKVSIPYVNMVKKSADVIKDVSLESNIPSTTYQLEASTNMANIIIKDDLEGRTYADLVVKYKYISRGDEDKSFDILQHELIGLENVPVLDVRFSLIMPKDFEQKDLYFMSGAGEKLNVMQTKTGNTITGYYTQPVDGGHLSLALKTEDDYFNSTKTSGGMRFILSLVSLLSTVMVIGGFAVAGISYWQYGRSEKPTVIPQSKPIKGLTPVDIIVAMSGGITNRDLMLYILQLANEGYITIHDSTNKNDKKRNVNAGYQFIKAKEYDGDDKYMKAFMKILFQSGDIVTPNDVSGKMYKKLDRLRLRIQNEGVDDLWDIDEGCRKICGSIGIIIPLLTSLLLSLYNLDTGFSVRTFSFVYGPLVTILISMAIKTVDGYVKKRNMSRGGVADTMTWIYVFGISFGVLIVSGSMNAGMFVHQPFLMTLAHLAEIILVYCSCTMMRRTPEGVELCGKILGFKQFIVDAGEVDIKRAVLADEQYLYRTLPLAVSLGIATEGWMAKMDGCHIDDPIWYSNASETEFRMVDFMRDWNEIIDTMIEIPDEE